MKILSALFLSVMAVAAFIPSAMAADKARVVAVNYPLQYMAARLLADEAEVIYPVPDGVDPSFWRPSIADISLVQSADLILLNGAGFAAWTTKVSLPRSRLVKTASGLNSHLITTQSITHSHGDGGEHSHEGKAAYLWMDPKLALAQAKNIAAAAKKRKLADASVIDARFKALTKDLLALDSMARAALNGAQDIVFVATHPRYQYLARAFGLTINFLEWEAGAAPTAAQLAELRKMVAYNGATVLIWEAEPPATARADIAALGLKDIVFPSLAVPSAEGTFIDIYKQAIADIAAVID